MHGRWHRAAAAASLIALALGTPRAEQDALKVQFTDTKMKNGLRVIIAEDHTAPVFSIAVNYDVGSRNERPGRTGFAHLFEHMMFKGSQNVGPGEHFTLVFNNGGNMNGTTNKERTLYFETLPANQLDLALFLEADRMKSLDISKENLDNQRHAVQEERRLGVDNQPYGKTFELVDQLAYENFGYKHSVIGSMEDLNAANVDDVASFFKTFYAPNNAVVAIVGDVDTKTTLAKMEKYFGTIPGQPAPPPVDVKEPAQTAERRQTIDDALARLARIDMVYKIPPATSPDADALSVLGTVLSSGRSSRMYENIVRQKQLASNVNAGPGESRGPSLFRVVGMVAPGKAVADLEAAIEAEFERVKSDPIADWELKKAQTSARRNFVGGLTSSLQRAITLTEYAIAYNDPGLINTRYLRLGKVTAADVQRVAKEYLRKENRTVVITMPKGGAAGPAGADGSRQPQEGGR